MNLATLTTRVGGLFLGTGLLLAADPAFRLEVVEAGSNWPIPLVEVRTTHQMRWFTDNAGVVAIEAPELIGRETYFHLASDGYEHAADGFGYRGVVLTPQPGKSARIELKRTQLARRLGRLTGAGQFAESQRTGQDLTWPESGIFGCDSVQTAVHRGRRYWLWGDTTLPQYPLGLFDSLGATTVPLPLTSFEPPLQLRFDFFRDERGRPRGITPISGPGPTWACALASLPDRTGSPRLVASYVKVRGFLEEYEWGLAVWNEATERFERLKVLWTKSDAEPKPPAQPRGHAVRWNDDTGKEWVLWGRPFPTLRCAATFEAWQDPTAWEPLTPPTELKAAGTGESVKPHAGVHSGGLGWHPWRQRWVTVFLQAGGKPSALGELWYAEARSPLGPWGPAVKVLTHQNYTFYNPCLHLDFTPTNSPVLLFEGTYTREFSGNPTATPRYDYNQILYRLDLDDPGLRPAHGSE